MYIPLLTLGSRGDVQPFAELARLLQDRGHRVVLGAPANAAAMAASLGVAFSPIAGDFEALTQGPDARAALGGNLAAMRRLQRATMSMTEEMIYRAAALADGAAAIVYHQKVLHGDALATANGAVGFRAMALPAIVPTREFPIPILPLPDWRLTNRLTYRIPALGTLAYRKILKRWRRSAGLSELVAEGPQVLYAFSPSLVPRPSDWPAGVHVTGYWRRRPATAEPERLPPRVVAFLQSGEAPVYVGFGSMAPTDPAARTAEVLAAVRRVGCRAILGRGWSGLGDGASLPDDVLAVDSVPHDSLFPRCRAVVHHGGAGTTHAGLRHGRPTLVCPFFADQPFWGARVAALGCGPVALPQKRFSAERFAERLKLLLGERSYRRRCSEVATLLQAEDGLARAADLVEGAAY